MVCNAGRARTQKIRRVRGKVWWAKRRRSLWFRELVENCVVYGDRGYRGREGVISQIKLFNAGSGWRTLTCVLV